MSGSTFDQHEQDVQQQQNAAGDIYNVQSYQKNPFEQEEIARNGGCFATGLKIMGGIGLAVGGLGFFGGILLTMLMGTSASLDSNSFQQAQQYIPLIVFGFAAFTVGMVLYAIGAAVARNTAYRKSLKSQHR